MSDADTEEDGSLWLGRTVGGRYRLDSMLGAGGIALVFEAQDAELGRTVAVKILKEATATREELRGRFAREARVLAALTHPHVVSLLDYGVEEGCPFLVMERLHGQTLGELLARDQRVPEERALGIVRQILGALAYAHGRGLLHRDLKPDNVFLQELDSIGDHVQLLDFGFAKFVAGDPREEGPPLTQAGKVFGTPRYMAPEQLSGGTVDGRVDLYAAAVILYEMLSGRRPFEGEIKDVLRAKIVDDPPPLATAAPDLEVPPEVEAFFAKTLATKRTDRPDDVAAMLELLDALPRPLARPKPPPEPPRATRAPARRALPMRAIAIGAAAFALLAACGIGAAVISLVGGSDELAKAPSPRVAEPEPAPPAAPAPPGRFLGIPDPWTGGEPLAAPVAFAHDAIVAGTPIDAALLRELREHAQQSPSDMRAQLALGHVYADRGMRAMAVGAYERAIELDPGARGEPRMLADLIAMVAEGSQGGPTRLIREHYGSAARPAVEAALRADGVDARERQRLEALLQSLR